MYYKIDLLPSGELEIIDRVEDKPFFNDGFIYANESDLKKINPKMLKDYIDALNIE